MTRAYVAQSLPIVLIAIAATVALDASTPYLAIEPGRSTSVDVVRALGEPVGKRGERLAEYKPQPGTGPILVEVDASGIVDMVEVALLAPIERAPLLRVFSLPEEPAGVEAADVLVEYFAAGRSLALKYETGDRDSGVASISYLSDTKFNTVAPAPARSTSTATPEEPTEPRETPTERPGTTTTTPLAPAREVVGDSNIPPSVRRNPFACYELFVWSGLEENSARRKGNVRRRQTAMAIKIASQSGDCDSARALTDNYKKQFGGKQ